MCIAPMDHKIALIGQAEMDITPLTCLPTALKESICSGRLGPTRRNQDGWMAAMVNPDI